MYQTHTKKGMQKAARIERYGLIEVRKRAMVGNLQARKCKTQKHPTLRMEMKK